MVLGVSAGIAAYKAVEVCRGLVDAGIHVAPVLTERATRFVGKATFDALGSEPAQISLWDEASPIPHTRLGQRADLIVVAPATADLLARYAGGFADDLLTATLMATAAPVVVCPAMHTEMWEHPAVQANLAVLRSRGVRVVDPEEGRLAGGDIGSGRLAEPSVIVAAVLDALGMTGAMRSTAADRRPHRRPSGGVGRRHPRTDRPGAVHHQPLLRKAGPCRGRRRLPPGGRGGAGHLERPAGGRQVTVERVETAADMETAVLRHADGADVVIMAAAVADFRPKVVIGSKLHKADGVPELVLEPTPDILAELGRRRRPGQVLVGFAAETDQVADRAVAKLVGQGRRPHGGQRRLRGRRRVRPRHQRGDHLRSRRVGLRRLPAHQGRGGRRHFG